MDKSLISVIVPAYNAEEYVLETLESVKNQSYKNWECIIVNDGSIDGTQKKIETFINGDSRFVLINTKNSGVSAARNTAVAHSNGYYIFPLDSDNYMHDDCLNRCIKEFEKKDKVKLVYTEARFFGARTDCWNLPPFEYKTMLKYNMVDNTALFLRSDFDKIGGYRLNMIYGLEDWDFFIALLYGSAVEQVVKINEPLYYYRVGSSGRGFTAVADGRQKKMLDLLVYNNFSIYQEYFPDIFTRIHDYDYHKAILNKPPVNFIVKFLNRVSKIKTSVFKK